MKFYLLLFFSLAFIADSLSQMNVVYAECTDDTYIQTGSTSNYSSLSYTYIDVSGTTVRRTYYKFDIAALNIPSNAIVRLARIRVKPYTTESGISGSTFTVQRANATWNGSSITAATQPSLETSDATSSTTLSGGYRFFDVTSQVSKFIAVPSMNLGFCVRRTSETSSTVITGYCSKEDPANRPVLEIQYYFPYSVSSATINPASTNVSLDASINPVVEKGPGGVNSYQWYNSLGVAIAGATNLNLTGVKYGWYGLKISSSTGIGSPVFMAFIVGIKCQEATIDFSPGPDYVDDITWQMDNLLNQSYNSNNLYFNAGYIYQGTFSKININTLIRFRLWVSPELEVTQANLNLYSAGHTGTSNAATLYRNTETFNEIPSFYQFLYSFPIFTTDGSVLIPSTTTNALNIDIKHFWNEWKLNNNQNYGLNYKGNTNSGTVSQVQNFYSSDASTSRPNIQFKVNRPCPNLSYAQLKKEIDAGYTYTSAGVLKFYFDETYNITQGKYLPLRIYNKNRVLLANVTLDGTVTLGSIAALPYNVEDNRRSLSLVNLGLVYGEMYLLEIETSTGENRYLKFIYKD